VAADGADSFIKKALNSEFYSSKEFSYSSSGTLESFFSRFPQVLSSFFPSFSSEAGSNTSTKLSEAPVTSPFHTSGQDYRERFISQQPLNENNFYLERLSVPWN